MKHPSDEWPYRKLEKLNITITEGYLLRTSETSGLARDQFMKTSQTLKWYNIYIEKRDFSRSKVHWWTSEPARLSSYFSRVSRQ